MYKLTQDGPIVRLSDGAFIPCDPSNADYQAYQAWCATGNTPQPADAPDPRIAVQAQIDAIEQATMVPRVMREFLLTTAELEAERQADALTAAGTPTTAEQLLAANIGYVKAKAVNDQIIQLRSQLK